MKALKINNTPARIDLNYQEVRESLLKELEQYRIVVTADTVGPAKKLATELNTMKKEVDQRRKDAVAEVSAPIKEADDQMKSLVALFDEGRKDILDQVKVFEDKTREALHELLAGYLTEQWEAKQVDPEFRQATIDDLVILSNMTAKGSITGKAMATVQNRVGQDKERQQTTAMRLERLKSQSYEAGLSAPLERQHVEAFLFADEATYADRLDRLMATERAREEISQQRMRQRIQREQAQEDAEAARQHNEPDPEPAPETAPQEPEAPRPTAKPGKQALTVWVRFDMELPEGTTDANIKEKFDAMMKKANIVAPYTLTVER